MTTSSIWLFRLGLLVCWLILNGLSAGQFLVGLVLALVIPIERVDDRRKLPTLWRLLGFARLLLSLLLDILQSGFSLARQVCAPRLHNRATWLDVPLTLENRHARAMLASCISLTPGTISVDIDDQRKLLLVHCLHVDDPGITIAQIHARYQQPLEELFA